MPTQSATYVDTLDSAKPGSGEALQKGDDHLRLIKAVFQSTFPNIAVAVTPTHAEINGFDTRITDLEDGYIDKDGGLLP